LEDSHEQDDMKAKKIGKTRKAELEMTVATEGDQL
jgi:hypothetical protein